MKEGFYDERLDCAYRLHGSENVVYKNGVEIFDYKTLNISRVYSAFLHQNGHKYFVFTKDLYGDSVLDLNTMQVFDYFPATSFSTQNHQAEETFIWCDIHYNPENNIVAVGGCIWASSSGVILAKFTDPMKETPQIDVYDKINTESGEINYVAWNGTDLILKMGYPCDEKQIVISADEYMPWLTADSNENCKYGEDSLTRI